MKIIYGIKYYRPREIAKLNLITNSTGSTNEDGNYNFILKLIKAGQLQAKNYGVNDARPYYLVSENEIRRYNTSFVRG